MTRRIIRILSLTLALMIVSGCAPHGAKKLFIYNWTYYIPDDVLREFEKRTGAAIVYDMYASNEEMFAKLKAGGTGYDLVFPSGDYVSIMIKENMLEKIDHEKVPAFAYLDTMALNKIRFDPGSRFSVPYMMGGAGVTVNKKAVPSFEKSWSVFNRADLKGRMTLLDDMREVLGAALKSQGHSVNTVNPAELGQAKRLVMQWRENIIKFDAEAFGKGFAAGEFWVVHGYAENVFLELDSSMRENAAFFIPQEGGAIYMDNMVILKDAKHKDLAYAFINFIHEPRIYSRIVDFLMLPSINVEARKYRKVKPNYEIADLADCEFKEDLGPALELYNKIWQEIRVGK